MGYRMFICFPNQKKDSYITTFCIIALIFEILNLVSYIAVAVQTRIYNPAILLSVSIFIIDCICLDLCRKKKHGHRIIGNFSFYILFIYLFVFIGRILLLIVNIVVNNIATSNLQLGLEIAVVVLVTWLFYLSVLFYVATSEALGKKK